MTALDLSLRRDRHTSNSSEWTMIHPLDNDSFDVGTGNMVSINFQVYLYYGSLS